MENNNDNPPIEPDHQKQVLKNETPAIVYDAISNVVLILEKYGWFIVLGIVISALIRSKLKPYWRKWKKKRDQQIAEAIDPELLAKRQETLEMSRRRMQEVLNAKGEEFSEKMKELDAKKHQEKIDDWEMHEQGRGYKLKRSKPDDGKPQESKDKPKKSSRLRNSDYNPLTGSSSGPSYRPNRNNTGGG